ncbi:hypothetical protein QS460_08110 [Liquorilactobacillus mali]|uniref:hypothetical protein n=2 Tax=Liquorilactobacillus mali TaxID=1618 RepID=UPI00235104E5|nr:hypothetical protein [Liquorilactobacillus mali]MDN7145892.1 hypothetical protein [Liquorilactobacillus mali]
MSFIREKIDYFIAILFSCMLGLTFIGAIRSDNLLISNTTARIFILPTLILAMFFLFRINTLNNFLKKNSLFFGIISLLLVFLLQLYAVYKTHPAIGFDLWVFHHALISKSLNAESAYFSRYQNNILMLLIQHGYLSVVGIKNYWFKLDLLNVILVDSSVLINVLSVFIYNKVYIARVIWIQAISLFFFPMILVPYSDTFILPFVSLELLFFVCIIKSKKVIFTILCSTLLGLVTSFVYFIKPSAIIPVIAIVIMAIIRLRKISKREVLTGSCFLLMLISSYVMIGTFVSTQKYIKISKQDNMPPIHFISIGMSGQKGGYNLESVKMMYKLKSPQQKKEYSIKQIKQTLEKRGPLGYIKFLISKQGYNTANGTFGWLQEGNFLVASSKVHTNVFKQYLYADGKYLSDFRFFAQILWVIALGILLLGFENRGLLENTLRLGIIGGFIFLLLFEGGRSRYMIQFLPMFVVLLTLISFDGITKFKRIFYTVKK